MHLHLLRVHFILGIIRRILVQVGQEDCLAVGWLDVLSRTAITVTAGTNFVVERAVDLVLFEIVRHGDVSVVVLHLSLI